MGFTARDFPADDDDLSELRGIGYLGISIGIEPSIGYQPDTLAKPLEEFYRNPRGAWDCRKAKKLLFNNPIKEINQDLRINKIKMFYVLMAIANGQCLCANSHCLKDE